MFGMTRKQFKKKSSQALKDTGPSILLLMEITRKQQKKTIPPEEAKTKLDRIRENVEGVFFNYEKISPPAPYRSLYFKVLRLLTHLQEVVTSNQEYLAQGADQQLEESLKLLEEFREEFHSLRREIESI
jgi:archaellum component FlaC